MRLARRALVWLFVKPGLLWDWSRWEGFQRRTARPPAGPAAAKKRGGTAPQAGKAPEERPARYVTTSLFLAECYRRLTRSPSEDMHLVTGLSLDGTFVLDSMVELTDVQRSLTGASAGPAPVRDALMLLEGYGLRCGGLFHSHPDRGPGGASPSTTDWRNQEGWEQAFPIVGGIFSRDGYVRFFSSSGRARVEVVGAKVEKIDENLFKLEVGQGVQVPGLARPLSGARWHR